MSRYYTPVLAIGKEFDAASEVVDFLSQYNVLSAEELQEIEDEGNSFITEILYERDALPSCSCLNLYSGEGYYLGFKVYCRSPKKFEAAFLEAKELWEKLFPNDPPEIIHTVIVS